ncbi:Uncharacterised protein [Moraxella equi]|uniref:Uncharacterized protein n=1 Tax=Moraxella equi TaxID=60442 RepID=A0A378QVE0_9GAMM|nr:Uncharacterised protein [Moraxella equi]
MDKPTWMTADIMEALMDNASSKTPIKPQTPPSLWFCFYGFIPLLTFKIISTPKIKKTNIEVCLFYGSVITQGYATLVPHRFC